MLRHFRVAELARLAGVTVRTLHHYDQIGLLRPASVSEAGYRLYSPADLTRLQQIATLQWLGFSLREIAELLSAERYDLASALSAQKAAVDAEIERLQQVSMALERAIIDGERHGAGAIDAATAAAIIRGVSPVQRGEWVRRYYSDAQWKALAERLRRGAPADHAAGQRAWAEVIAGFAALRGSAPDAPAVQELAARAAELVRGFTGGDPAMLEALGRLEREEPRRLRELRGYDEETQRLIQAALAVYHKRHGAL